MRRPSECAHGPGELKKRPRHGVGGVDRRRGIVPRSYGMFDVRGPTGPMGTSARGQVWFDDRAAGGGLTAEADFYLWYNDWIRISN